MHSSRALELLATLVAIPSINPAYDPESAGEAQIATFVASWARALGLTTRRQTVFPGRDNILVRLEGPANAPVLLFESHMDTVSAAVSAAGNADGIQAFTPTVRDGRLYGRGACDTKSTLAAMMAAIESLLDDRASLACSIELLAAVDEETGGAGVKAHVAAGARADAAIVGEPTELRVVHAHNGCVRGEINVIGRAAHTSVAGEGINAITGMADVVLALRDLHETLVSAPGGVRANGSMTVSLIDGGTGINIVPARCTISYDRRIVPGQTVPDALAEIDATLDTLRASHPDLGIERQEPSLTDDALNTPTDSAIVRIASKANRELDLDPVPAAVHYGSDATKLSTSPHVAGGIPSIVYGPGSIAQAHGADEYVEIAQVEAAAAFYRGVALAFGRSD
jgi:acetylornithine deacetylase/succinyl-diaminopimelate desuccinylase-like protein